jgi:hypothetical protein
LFVALFQEERNEKRRQIFREISTTHFNLIASHNK